MSELILPILLPLLILFAVLVIIVYFWCRSRRPGDDHDHDIEDDTDWDPGVKSLFVSPRLHYHSSLLYDRMVHAISSYDKCGSSKPARQRSPTDESDASKDTNVSVWSSSSPLDYRLSSGEDEMYSKERARMTDFGDDSCFDSLPYDVNIAPIPITCTALVHKPPVQRDDYDEDPIAGPSLTSVSESETGDGYLKIIPSPYVNIVMGEIMPRPNPSLVTRASDIYENLPKWSDMGQLPQRGRMHSSGSPDVSFGAVNLDSLERKSERHSSSDAWPNSLPLSSLEDEVVVVVEEVEINTTGNDTLQVLNNDTDDGFVSLQEGHVFEGRIEEDVAVDTPDVAAAK